MFSFRRRLRVMFFSLKNTQTECCNRLERKFARKFSERRCGGEYFGHKTMKRVNNWTGKYRRRVFQPISQMSTALLIDLSETNKPRSNLRDNTLHISPILLWTLQNIRFSNYRLYSGYLFHFSTPPLPRCTHNMGMQTWIMNPRLSLVLQHSWHGERVPVGRTNRERSRDMARGRLIS